MPLSIPSSLQSALTRPIAIFGDGLSGQGVLAVLRQLGATAVIYDQKGNQFTAQKTESHTLVVFSPGFAPNHPWLVTACEAGLECMGELDFAALFWRGRVIGITGTNGKTTLTEFLTHALRQRWEPAHAVGNIGRPFTRLVADTAGGTKEDMAICEVSSFQAETIQHFKAEAVLWTNFAEDHLDRHPTMESYMNAKWHLITRTSEDTVFVARSVYAQARKFNLQLPMSAWIDTAVAAPNPKLAGTVFGEYPQRENFLLAAAWWQHAKLPLDDLYAAAKSFRLGRHRMARVAEIAGVTFWNDSKATNFHAVESALGRFAEPVNLILGGRPKGGDLGGFIGRIASRVRRLFLIGETTEILATASATHGVPHLACATLESALEQAFASARSGGNVVFSPGFASFDMFRSYEDRGDQFEHLVQELGKRPNLR
ncbi:MAG: UDP-N-acetylmuramoyl-L-alanine--D-glutamate ligase [Cephaloticoccus sp.]|nr:UDP-N-acetylmuramoyl-L-alanine--D-glutamate ligase [Cephaloticoccus sp.]MCF7760166.1 UDP-N-acetylmuramoyl-L-alanine--D-glutamate ligase [Cephaloticoccus sp.]